MSIGPEPMPLPGDSTRGAATPRPHLSLTPDDAQELKAATPSASVNARPEFVEVTPTSVVKENLILRLLQRDVDALLSCLDASTPADVFHTDIGKFALEEIEKALRLFVPEGTDVTSAIAAIKSWTEPFISEAEAASSQVKDRRSVEERAQLQDQKTLLSVAQRLERIHLVLSEENPKTQRELIISNLRGGRPEARDLSSQLLLRYALLETSADLARRTLDFSGVCEAADISETRAAAVDLLANFGSESDPGPGMNFRSLPYLNPQRVEEARSKCLKSLWGACRYSMISQDHSGFNSSFSALVLYGRQAMYYFHEVLKRAALPTNRLTPTPQSGTPLEKPTERMTRVALALLGRFGPEPFAPYITFDPKALDSLLSADDVIQDALLLSQHLGSTLIQEYALMLLKSCAFKRVPKADITDSSAMIGDDHPDYMRQYDTRVLKKFDRLSRQVHDMEQRQRCCVLSMSPLNRVLAFAANMDDRPVSVIVQKDSLNDLETKLRHLAPRLRTASDPTEISSIFMHVRGEMMSAPPTADTEIALRRRDILELIHQQIGSQ